MTLIDWEARRNAQDNPAGKEDENGEVCMIAKRVLADLHAFFKDEETEASEQTKETTMPFSLEELSIILDASIQKHDAVVMKTKKTKEKNRNVSVKVSPMREENEETDEEDLENNNSQTKYNFPFAKYQSLLKQKTKQLREWKQEKRPKSPPKATRRPRERRYEAPMPRSFQEWPQWEPPDNQYEAQEPNGHFSGKEKNVLAPERTKKTVYQHYEWPVRTKDVEIMTEHKQQEHDGTQTTLEKHTASIKNDDHKTHELPNPEKHVVPSLASRNTNGCQCHHQASLPSPPSPGDGPSINDLFQFTKRSHWKHSPRERTRHHHQSSPSAASSSSRSSSSSSSSAKSQSSSRSRPPPSLSSSSSSVASHRLPPPTSKEFKTQETMTQDDSPPPPPPLDGSKPTTWQLDLSNFDL